MLEVIAILYVRPETAAETEKLLLPLIEGSRQDAGNISYSCNAVAGCPGTYVFRESWENQALLDEHMKQKHFTDFAAAVAPLATKEMSVYVMGGALL